MLVGNIGNETNIVASTITTDEINRYNHRHGTSASSTESKNIVN